jgi:hypothetical protein
LRSGQEIKRGSGILSAKACRESSALSAEPTNPGRRVTTRMTALISTLRTTSLFGVLAFFVTYATPAEAETNPGVSAEIDDGWRRTRDGWEHISTWDIPQAHVAYQAPPAFSPSNSWHSWDHYSLLHPAAIALTLFLVGWAGLTLPAAVQPPGSLVMEN